MDITFNSQTSLSSNELLKLIYDDYINGKEPTEFVFDDETPEGLFDYLLGKGYIKSLGDGINGGIYTMASDGVDYVNNGYKDLNPSAPNVVINGSNNTISGSFNTFYTEIESLDVDEPFKQEIRSLIADLNASKADSQTLLSKISAFVNNVLKTSAVNIAADRLTALIYALFSGLSK